MKVSKGTKIFNKFVSVFLTLVFLATGALFLFDLIVGFFYVPLCISFVYGLLVALCVFAIKIVYTEYKETK